jgi:orotate phosphoribosyltransferase
MLDTLATNRILTGDGMGRRTIAILSPASRAVGQAPPCVARARIFSGFSMPHQTRSRLLELFKQRAFSFGDFTLASGKKSSYYINSKKAIFYSEAVALLGELLWESTKDLNIQAMGGLEVGAIPMTTAAAMRYHHEGRTLEGFFVRKETKSHGSQERIEGVLEPGMRCVMVDDVLTTGGSVLQAIEEVNKRGALIQAVVCIVDRLEGAQELLAPRYPYKPLFTIRDFGVSSPS